MRLVWPGGKGRAPSSGGVVQVFLAEWLWRAICSFPPTLHHWQVVLSNIAMLAENGQCLLDSKLPEEFLIPVPMRLSEVRKPTPSAGLSFILWAAFVILNRLGVLSYLGGVASSYYVSDKAMGYGSLTRVHNTTPIHLNRRKRSS